MDNTGSASNTASKRANGRPVTDISRAKAVVATPAEAQPTSPTPNSSTCESVPEEVLRLSDLELREKLVSLGEKPGPVNGTTRKAYQNYLAKIMAGVQPTGNRGYKGN